MKTPGDVWGMEGHDEFGGNHWVVCHWVVCFTVSCRVHRQLQGVSRRCSCLDPVSHWNLAVEVRESSK